MYGNRVCRAVQRLQDTPVHRLGVCVCCLAYMLVIDGSEMPLNVLQCWNTLPLSLNVEFYVLRSKGQANMDMQIWGTLADSK